MFLNFTGTGSAFNTEKGNSCAYFEKENNLYLIDCGEDVFAKIKDKLHRYTNINIFITHTHSDHIGSLPTLCLYCYFILKNKVKLYFNDDYILTILKNTGVYDYVDLRYNKKDNVDFNFILTSHVKEIKSYGIFFPEFNIYYSGDSSELISIEGIKEHYQDVCMSNYPNNVHLNIDLFDKKVKDLKLNKEIFILYHFDNEECIKRAVELGYKVATKS